MSLPFPNGIANFVLYLLLQASVNYGRIGDRVIVLSRRSGKRGTPAIVISKVIKKPSQPNKSLRSIKITDKIEYVK